MIDFNFPAMSTKTVVCDFLANSFIWQLLIVWYFIHHCGLVMSFTFVRLSMCKRYWKALFNFILDGSKAAKLLGLLMTLLVSNLWTVDWWQQFSFFNDPEWTPDHSRECRVDRPTANAILELVACICWWLSFSLIEMHRASIPIPAGLSLSPVKNRGEIFNFCSGDLNVCGVALAPDDWTVCDSCQLVPHKA